jgi:hypothetical protein
MPLQVAEYLRHLAVRCSRLSRDCYDPLVAKELEIISVELVERAETLEAGVAISESPADKKDPPSS